MAMNWIENSDFISLWCLQITDSRFRVQSAHSPPESVTATAEQMVAQWIATTLLLVAQLHSAALATIALDVIFPLLDDHSYNFSKFIDSADGFLAALAEGNKVTLVVLHADDGASSVHGEGHPVQAFPAFAAAKTGRMEGGAECLQNHISDHCPACLALQLMRKAISHFLMLLLLLDSAINLWPALVLIGSC